MRVVITGPRSVGKSTISKLLAKKLKIRYFSSDYLMNSKMKRYGGLDAVIKSRNLHLIVNQAIPQVNKVLRYKNFVYDLAGGAISSKTYNEISLKIRRMIKKECLVIGLLPYTNKKRSIDFLFNREKGRKHFRKTNREELRKEVVKDFKKYTSILPIVCNHIIYVTNKKPTQIVTKIIELLK